jgi:hypothetical protein
MMRRRWQCLVGSALSLAISATALAQGATAPPTPPAAPPASGEPAPPPPTTPTPPAPAQPGTPPQPGTPAPLSPPPGYPQQQPGYPPPGYPPPAYPQQPGYPPPGYSQQPGYPPPGYAYPPPGYPQQQPPGYPPPGYAYPPSYYARPAPPPPAGKHGFLAMVFLGVNSFAGSTGQNKDVGFRLGTIMGGRVNESFSINGEFTVDVLDPKNSPNVDVTAFEVDLALSPLFHVETGNVELVIGPKLGFMIYELDDSGGSPLSKGNGYVYGLNAGAFASVSRSVSIGGLISFAGRKFTQFQDCLDGTCLDDANKPSADKVFGITGAVLF